MADQIHIEKLFRKYLAVQCTSDEIKELFVLIGKKENEKVFDYLIAEVLSENSPEPLDEKQEDRAISKVESILLSEIRAQIPSVKEKKFPYKIANSWLRIAVLWLLAGSATMFLLFRHFNDSYNAKIKQHTKQLITKNGQLKLIQLYDGTKIWLCPSSTLNYEDQLINNFREVTLNGEALFEVAKDKAHPFIIHSPEVVADFRRYYNKNIELENKSATCLCYGEFDTTKPINIVLRQLAAAISCLLLVNRSKVV